MSSEITTGLVGNRTRDLAACSIDPLQRTPNYVADELQTASLMPASATGVGLCSKQSTLICGISRVNATYDYTPVQSTHIRHLCCKRLRTRVREVTGSTHISRSCSSTWKNNPFSIKTDRVTIIQQGVLRRTNRICSLIRLGPHRRLQVDQI
jgi:hypothetical protein